MSRVSGSSAVDAARWLASRSAARARFRACPVAVVCLLLALSLAGCLRWQSTAFDYSADGARQVAMIGDVDVHYSLEGPEDGPPVVLVHGFGSQLGCWEPLMPALSRDHRVLRMDLAGFGRSSRYPGDYSREAQADLVLALMDMVGMERADLVGHSMGTAIVLTAALRAPDRVGRVVLVSPWLYEEQVPWALRDARQPGIGELIFGAWFAEHLDWRFRLSFYDPDAFVSEEMVRIARKELRRPGSRAASLAVVRGIDPPGLGAELGRVRAPALVVSCEQDPVALPEFAARLAAELPRAELATMSECAHFPMIEHAAAFASLALGFLERPAGGREPGPAPSSDAGGRP